MAGRSPWLLASGGAAAEPANISTLLFWESSTNTTSTYSYNTMRVDARWTNVTPAGETIIVTNSPPAMRLLFLGNSLLASTPPTLTTFPLT